MRISPLLSIALLTTVPLGLRGQSFVNSYGAALAQDGVGVVQLNGGFTVGVRSFMIDPSRFAAGVMSTSNGGTVLAEDVISVVPGNVFLQAVANSSDGGIFLAGSSIVPGADTHDAFLLKRGSNGTIAWTSQPSIVGDEQYFVVEPLLDGGTIAAGVRNSGTGHDAWVTRFAGDGSVVWSTAVGGISEEEAYDLTMEGNDVLLTGIQLNFSGTTDAWLARMDLDGSLIWISSWGGDANETGRGLVALSSSTFLLCGTTNSFGMLDSTENRIKDNLYFVAFDLNGDTLWTRSLGDTLFDRNAYCMDIAPNGDLLIGGERMEVPGESDALVCRLTSTGDLLWERTWHIGKEDRLLCLLALSDGFISTGWSFTELSRQVLLLRRDPNGN